MAADDLPPLEPRAIWGIEAEADGPGVRIRYADGDLEAITADRVEVATRPGYRYAIVTVHDGPRVRRFLQVLAGSVRDDPRLGNEGA